jgi:hypothetical protein
MPASWGSAREKAQRDAMSKPAGTAELALHGSKFANYYTWEEPNRDITVCLSLEVANRLQMEVLRSGSTPNSARVEIGGILLGRRELLRGRTLTVIDDFDVIGCQSRKDTFYSLSAKDHQQWGAMLRRRRSEPKLGASVVGYYRSHEREDLFLSSEDLTIIRSHFADPDSVFLVIKALPGMACTAGFFFWENGRIQSEFTNSEVALMPTELSPVADPPETHPVESIKPEVLPDSSSADAGTNRFRWAFGGLAFVVIAAGTVLGILRYRDERTPLGEATSLTAVVPERVAPILAARQENHGQAAIADRDKEIPADSEPERPKHSGLPRQAAAKRKPERFPVAELTRRRKDQPTVIEAAAKTPATIANDRDHAAQATHTDESPVLRPSRAALSAEAPPAKPDESAAIASPVPLPAIVSAPSAPERAIATDQQKPAPLITAPTVPPQTPDRPLPVERSFVAPQIVHQVAPAIPLGVGPKITTSIQIDVKVTVDDSGKVVGAHVSSSRGAAAGLLTLEVLKAAQLFRFRPARENDRPVRGEAVLTFRFAPKAQ